MIEKNSLIIPDEFMINKIHHIRGQKVMLESDLGEHYGVETKVLNQAISRNFQRFPSDFMFRLNEQGGRRKVQKAFKEQGVAMISSVLNSERAINVNIQIIRIFTRIRQMLIDNTDLRLEIEKIKTKLDSHGKNMELVFRFLDELIVQKAEAQPRKRTCFKSDEL